MMLNHAQRYACISNPIIYMLLIYTHMHTYIHTYKGTTRTRAPAYAVTRNTHARTDSKSNACRQIS